MVKKMSKGFQCPESGLLHFYDRKAESLNNDDDCFNALSRTHFISTVAKENIMLKNRMFQCPKSGSLHFYDETRKIFIELINGFNALSRAHFISTEVAEESVVGNVGVSMP